MNEVMKAKTTWAASKASRWDAKDVARLGMLLALATTLHIFEAQLPALPIPGAKIGLANLVSLFALYAWGMREALLIAIMRQLVGSLVTGTLFAPAFAFGFAGALLSVLTMGAVKAVAGRIMGPVAISLLGAVAHNTGQLFVAWALLGQVQVFFYLPYLLWFAVPSGSLVGLTMMRLLPVTKAIVKENFEVKRRLHRITAWATAGALALAGVGAASSLFWGGEVAVANPTAYVTAGGADYAHIPLDEHGFHEVVLPEGRMVIETDEGRVRVAESTCRHQVCVRSGWIGQPHQSIVCLPFQVVITVVGGEGSEDPGYDALVY